MNGSRVYNLPSGLPNTAITFVYSTSLLSDATASCLPLVGSRNMSEALNINCNAINYVTNPVGNQDVPTKNYVDASINSCLALNGSRHRVEH